ncbi:MAG TPA: hypothetical protein VGH79_12530 [Gaiellaceae bacterium]|jgi:hypothetical protein
MKRIARLTILLGILAAAVATSIVGSSSAAVAAPTGLHGFMLRANEGTATSFHRTPSFAWKPVRGAVRYEFQLATSDTFRENSILYDVSNLQTPVAAPSLTLPWITGSPHSLYARVRAFVGCGCNSTAGPWSADFGFDVVPPPPPTPMSSDPGLLRWTPVDGANEYEVWLLDTGKIESVDTNVLDEREYYAFHTSQDWIGTVHWRVRAVRWDEIDRKNGLPVSFFGPWSSVYTSSNPDPSTGQIHLDGTISDTVSNGSLSSAAHSLTPAFVWSGNQTLDGTPEQFFRVEVFTDSACLNRVYTGSVVATNAYAPRMFGGLAMPMSEDAEGEATTEILGDVAPGLTPVPTFDLTADGEYIPPNEDLQPAKPTVSIGNGADLKILNPQAVGAPVDLWDVNWPSSGYYWTVIPVALEQWPDGGHWQDLEVAQDVCAAGRVARFGVSSQPSVTKNNRPYATGLSAQGHLVSAPKTSTFYGEPLVAWTPAPQGEAYEVQWSKKAYPWTVRGKRLTWDTSMVLPLKPGTWFYRVRGYDYNLPTGAQELAWSQPVRIVVAAPKLRILH